VLEDGYICRYLVGHGLIQAPKNKLKC